jgi:predicted esterase YcpF (UPF0227 family)
MNITLLMVLLRMNLVYLHGFQSSPFSIKGQQLKHYCQIHHPEIQVHLPDLNLPPLVVVDVIQQLIEELDQVVLVGSSFGGFYATQFVAKYALPAVDQSCCATMATVSRFIWYQSDSLLGG